MSNFVANLLDTPGRVRFEDLPVVELFWRKTGTDGSWSSWLRDRLSRTGTYGRGTDHLEMGFGEFYSVSSFVEDKDQQYLTFSFDGRTITLPRRKEGVQFISRQHPTDHWITARLRVTPEQYKTMLALAIRLATEIVDEHGLLKGPHGYDEWGVARFVLPFFKEHPWDYFCSEVVVEILQAGGQMPSDVKAWKMGPNAVKEWFGVKG